MSTALAGPGVPPALVGKPLPAAAAVTLVTGQRVRLDVAPDGQQSAVPDGTAGVAKPDAAQFTGFTFGGDTYLVPDQDIPYVGSVLDLRLFDVSYLVRAGLDDAHSGSLPVTVSYSGGPRPLSLPGVRVRRASGVTASAVVVKAQASRLGALLASRWAASQAGRRAATARLLPGIERISLAPAPGAPPLPADPERLATTAPAQPGGQGPAWHTLTLHLIDLRGKPTELAFGFAQNVDDLNLGRVGIPNPSLNPATAYSVSVPQGTYSLVFVILTPESTASGTSLAVAEVVKPQVRVDSDRMLTLDARTARSYSARLATSPGSGYVRDDTLTFTRTSVTGGSFNFLQISSGAGSPFSGLRATPTAPVTKGTLGFSAASELYDPAAGPGHQPPRYYLVFPHQGSIPSSLRYTVPRSGLAAVHERIYGSASGAQDTLETLYPIVYLAWGSAGELSFGGPDSNVWPGQRTDYWYSTVPQLAAWQNNLTPNDSETAGSLPELVSRILVGQLRVIHAGQQLTETWNKGPQAPPSVAAAEPRGSFLAVDRNTICAACRQHDIGMVYLSPDGDSDLSHYDDASFGAVTAFRFYRNGTLAISSNALADPAFAAPFGFTLPLLPRPATYRLDWTANVRVNDPAAVTTTEWTFHSGPADPVARLPRSEECPPDPSQGCSFLPLLYLTYDLPLNRLSQAKAGQPLTIGFTVEHQQRELPPAGLSATVSASFDGGKTWTAPQPAASKGGNRFSATISQPALSATSGFASLRITARDNAGNAVTQTIIKAYGLTS